MCWLLFRPITLNKYFEKHLHQVSLTNSQWCALIKVAWYLCLGSMTGGRALAVVYKTSEKWSRKGHSCLRVSRISAQ